MQHIVYILMSKEKDKKDKKIVKDALGRPVMCDKDSLYFISFEKPIKDISEFYKNIEKTISDIGFIKCHRVKPKGVKNLAKIKIKEKSKLASLSIPEHFSIINKILTSYPDENLSVHEWNTIKYTGYCGIYHPAGRKLLLCDPYCIDYKGIEYSI